MGNEAQAEWERRRQPRCLLRKDAKLKLADGRVVNGHTDDAGTGGVFFVLAPGEHAPEVGEQGVLILSSPYQEVEEISCQVAHHRSNGVGLKVDTRDGRFGVIVSSDLYLNLQKSVGIEIPDRVHVRVALTLDEGRVISGRVKNLTRGHVVFHNALNDPGILEVGAAAAVVISSNHTANVEGRGRIRSHRLLRETGTVGRERQLDYCTVALDDLPGEAGRRMEELLNFVQNAEIWGVMRQQATRNASTCRQPAVAEKRSPQELYKEFNKFFGFPPASA